MQQFGYSSLRTKKGPLNSVNYKDYVFKLLTLTGFEDDYAVFLNDRNKKMYIRFSGDINDGKLDDIAPVAEIDSARSLYLGKTLWLKKDFLNLYDPNTDEFSKIHVTKLSPVKVVEVLAGFFEYEPVMLTVETEDHRRGFIACSLSGTNLTESLAESCSFNNYFFETNPRLQYQWSESIWVAIINSELKRGMTMDQVFMSWGEPASISKSKAGSSVFTTYKFINPKERYAMFNSDFLLVESW